MHPCSQRALHVSLPNRTRCCCAPAPLCPQALSGAARATIDATRTLFIWLVAMALGWERFLPLQVVGFAVLFAGEGRQRACVLAVGAVRCSQVCEFALFAGG